LDDGGEMGPPIISSISSYGISAVAIVALMSIFLSPLRFAGVVRDGVRAADVGVSGVGGGTYSRSRSTSGCRGCWY
jgi:hypothetical protein